MLADMVAPSRPPPPPLCAEAEFRAYHLLSLMAGHGKFKGDQQAYLSTLQVRDGWGRRGG